MKNLRLYFKSLRYSLGLLYHSSGLWYLMYWIFWLVSSTIPLLSTFIFKLLLKELTRENPD